jgi:ketosteroid isomerase-like protein
VDHTRLARDTWSAVARGDLDVMQAAPAPDARWRAVHVVLTVRDGLIVEVKGCADRAAALRYARMA